MIQIEYVGRSEEPIAKHPLYASGRYIHVTIDSRPDNIIGMHPGDILRIHDFPVLDKNGNKVGWIEVVLKYCDDINKDPP